MHAWASGDWGGAPHGGVSRCRCRQVGGFGSGESEMLKV